MGVRPDLPKLKELEIDYGTFYGYYQDDWDYRQNEFILRSGECCWIASIDLPSLTRFYGGGCNFSYVGKVIMDSRSER